MPIAYPVPPVPSGSWSPEGWARYIKKYGVEIEPPVINSTFGKFYKTDQRDVNGDALYHWEGADNETS